jgi:hypothetical protein
MHSRLRTFAVVVVAAIAGIMMISQAALAHEQRTVGKIQMTVGWAIEPTYTGFRNDVQCFLKDAAGKPITDLGDNDLKIQIIYGDQKSALVSLDPSFDPDTGLGTPGEYDHAIVPTRPGNYTFHFVGTVHGQKIDQSFTSSEKTFDPVQEAGAAEFPVKDPSSAELSALVQRLGPRIDAAQSAATDASGAAGQNRSLAIAGIVLGALGIVVGLRPRSAKSK